MHKNHIKRRYLYATQMTSISSLAPLKWEIVLYFQTLKFIAHTKFTMIGYAHGKPTEFLTIKWHIQAE